jgi:DeoR family fructose operon transcriptional repressor
MARVKRQRGILEWLKQEPIVMVRDMADRYNVAESTIRRDLEQLQERGLIDRAHGCAISKDESSGGSPFSARTTLNIEAKQASGQAASMMIHPGETVFIDGGTTTEYILPNILHLEGLTIVTCGLNIVLRLLENPQIRTILIGGLVTLPSMSLIPLHRNDYNQLSELRVDKAFISASSVSAEYGVMNSFLDRIPTKRMALEISKQAIVVVDGSKVGKISLGEIAPISDFDFLATDATAPQDELEKIRALNVVVLVAENTN